MLFDMTKGDIFDSHEGVFRVDYSESDKNFRLVLFIIVSDFIFVVDLLVVWNFSYKLVLLAEQFDEIARLVSDDVMGDEGQRLNIFYLNSVFVFLLFRLLLPG